MSSEGDRFVGMRLSDLLEAAVASERRPRPLAEAQVATLREHLALATTQPYAVGDLVTYRPHTGIREDVMGIPMIVDTALPAGEFAGEGRRLNVRCLYIDDDGDVVAAWAEARCLMSWSAGEEA